MEMVGWLFSKAVMDNPPGKQEINLIKQCLVQANNIEESYYSIVHHT